LRCGSSHTGLSDSFQGLSSTMDQGELGEIRAELQTVKRALNDGSTFLGMKGEPLTRYLLQLQEKENLLRQHSLLSHQMRHMSVSGGNGDLPSVAATNGSKASARPAVVLEPARPAPEGEPKAFNKDSQSEVVEHMTVYEAVPLEAVKALRCVSSLAYANAASVGGDDRLVAQLLRLVALHPAEQNVETAAMRALCNMAYDQDISVKKLTNSGVLTALLAAVSLPAGSKEKTRSGEAAAKAGEALARIVAAEVNPEGNGMPAKLVVPEVDGPLVGLFVAAGSGEAAVQEAVPRLIQQFVANEVCEVKALAQRFGTAAQTAGSDASVAIGWMSLAKLLASTDDTVPQLPQALVDAGAIKSASGLMERLPDEASLQLAGVEAMSALVGNRWGGLQCFAEVGGMKRIEAALEKHGDATVLQTKGIRALASGIQWPQDVQQKAGYNSAKAVALTKTALSQHSDAAELIQAGLEALSKYLDKLKCKDLVMENGGESLVKQIMTRHTSNQPVCNAGRTVLDHLGVDRSWKPGETPVQA
jgi:hypothetical protein